MTDTFKPTSEHHSLTSDTPYTPFTVEYDEGWAVFETDQDDGTHWSIQRLESPQDARTWHPAEPLFESDEAARAFVRKRAEEGSRYHREALAWHGKFAPFRKEKSSDHKLREFVKTIAKQSTRQEERGWMPEEVSTSDKNQNITEAQANYADELIETARELTGIKVMSNAKAIQLVLDIARAHIGVPGYVCDPEDEKAIDMVEAMIVGLNTEED